MAGFVVGQPVVWGELPFVVTAAAHGGITALRPHDGTDGDPDDGVAFVGDEADVSEVLCVWFARCDHTATSLEPHPTLGPVPICDRCREKNARLR